MKKIVALLLTFVLCCTLFAAVSFAGESEDYGITEDYLVRIGIPTGGKHYQNFNVETFAAIVEEKSGGHITCELYPAGQLGTVSQMIESVLDGTLQGVAMPAAYLATFAPAISVLELPFFFDAEIGVAEQSFQILNEGTSLDDYLASKGFVVASWARSGDNFILSTAPITSAADMVGKKIRCHTSKIVQDTLTAIGAAPTMVDTSELASSLSNGTIDATESDAVFAFTQKYYEVTGNYLKLPLRPNSSIFTLSADWMESLPENVQQCVKDSAKEAVALEYDYYLDLEKTCYENMEAEGVNIVTPDEQFVEDLKELTSGIVDEYIAIDEDCARIFEEFKGLVENYGK